MIEKHDVGPGEDALCHLGDAELRDAVEAYEADLASLPPGTEAHRILTGLVEAGRKELDGRAGEAEKK